MPKEAIHLSYSRRDEAFVTQLSQSLTERGLSVWLDKAKDLALDERRAEVVKSIQECKVCLLVLSPASAASPEVLQEVNLANRHQKPIVPLIWRSTEVPDALKVRLAGMPWLDFGGEVTAEKLNELVEVLERYVGHDLAPQ